MAAVFLYNFLCGFFSTPVFSLTLGHRQFFLTHPTFLFINASNDRHGLETIAAATAAAASN
jgi:hypothetical protein